jgi:prolyl-tRNA editing enzyme YbaK/EbsC (Cys-tRNA(Pro) deacylase)
MTIFVDEDLLQFETVWAAAGTPHTVFAIGPEALVKGCGGTAVNLKK